MPPRIGPALRPSNVTSLYSGPRNLPCLACLRTGLRQGLSVPSCAGPEAKSSGYRPTMSASVSLQISSRCRDRHLPRLPLRAPQKRASKPVQIRPLRRLQIRGSLPADAGAACAADVSTDFSN